MVHRKTRKHTSISSSLWLFAIILAIIMIALGTIVGISTKNLLTKDEETLVEDEPEESVEPPKEYPIIDFQPEIDEWAATISGNHSVIIYDLENSQVVGEYNPEASYDTASLYKLFVVYEGYRRLESGEWQADAPAGNTGYNILACLDLAIRESYSPCAESLWTLIGRENLDSIIVNDFNITNSDISHLTSNPYDILAIMKLFYEHPDITDETYLAQIKDSFLMQPPTTYDWRQGLPSGFGSADVYNKVGWDYNPAGYWNIYHDAAIIDFPEQDRHYIVVVMTNNVPFERIRDLGTIIENTFISKY